MANRQRNTGFRIAGTRRFQPGTNAFLEVGDDEISYAIVKISAGASGL
jgi:hypothetical protein